MAHDGVDDAQYARIRSFPFVRIDRFLASFADELDSAAKRRAWLTRLAAHDREARAVEMTNLGDAPGTPLVGELNDCRTALLAKLLQDTEGFERLRQRATVADDYADWKRWLGMYPLSSRFVLASVARLQQREAPQWSPTDGALDANIYAIPPPPPSAARLSNARDALGIPILAPNHTRALLSHHAPQWIVETTGGHDEIGAAGWRSGRPYIDARHPAAYTHIAFTRFGGDVLTQLVYVVWFSARPRTQPFDILGGKLDGITWRVTLDRDGEPLTYDAMHTCGCYHMFFPTAKLRGRDHAQNAEEPLWVPISLASTNTSRLALHIASGTHYIRGLSEALAEAPAGTQPLELRDYTELRTMPTDANGNRSLFGADGIVAGSERRERWLLWPMGIASPGAMRQWGHHATAFVGRRHFDEAHLIERYFERAR